MAKLLEINDQTTTTAIYDVTWAGQTFTTTGKWIVNSIEMYVAKLGTPIGNMTVAIRATSSDLPTGSDLVSKAVAATSISTTPGWQTFTFDTPITLSKDTKYALIYDLRSCVNASNTVSAYRSTSSVYSSGAFVSSSNSGSTWSETATRDFSLRINGTLIAGGAWFMFM